MNEVVQFKSREERDKEDLNGWVSGPIRCRGCGHKWIGVNPGGVYEFECPECGTMKGVRDTFVTPERRFVCNCGCDVFSFSEKNVYCANCGDYHEPWA